MVTRVDFNSFYQTLHVGYAIALPRIDSRQVVMCIGLCGLDFQRPLEVSTRFVIPLELNEKLPELKEDLRVERVVVQRPLEQWNRPFLLLRLVVNTHEQRGDLERLRCLGRKSFKNAYRFRNPLRIAPLSTLLGIHVRAQATRNKIFRPYRENLIGDRHDLGIGLARIHQSGFQLLHIACCKLGLGLNKIRID